MVILLASCAKQKVDLLFDKLPEVRMAERNAELRAKLTENANGWKAFMRTSAKGGGYGFYMKFNADETVSMYSDWDNTTATTAKSSTYSIRYIMNTSLIFDTYNYISIMQDPQKSVNGGTQPDGLQSDIEFEYIRAAGDSIVLRGKKYQNYLYLVKASAQEKQNFENAQYPVAVTKLNNYFNGNFPYIMVDNKKLEFEINALTKVSGIDYISSDNKVTSGASGFAYAIDGAYFNPGLTNQGVTIMGIRFKDATNTVAYDANGKEYPLISQSAPSVPLWAALGSKFKLQAKFKTINPGTSSLGSTIIGHYVNNLDNGYSGYIFNDGNLTFTFNTAAKTLTVGGWHNQNGNAGWITSIVFNYTTDADNYYNFTLRTAAADGYVAKLMNETGKETIQKFLLGNKIQFDYYTQSNVSYGRMTSITNPAIVITLDLLR